MDTVVILNRLIVQALNLKKISHFVWFEHFFNTAMDFAQLVYHRSQWENVRGVGYVLCQLYIQNWECHWKLRVLLHIEKWENLDSCQVAIRPAFSRDIFTLQVLYSLPFDIYEIHLSLIVYYTHCNCDYQLQIFTPDCYFTSLFHI